MSLEMGEHIPPEHEWMVLRNLHAHNCRGLILSWGALNQSGHFHVNNHGQTYLVTKLEGLGYRVSRPRTDLFRNNRPPPPRRYMHPAYGVAQLTSVTVFERITPLVACLRQPPVCAPM